MEVGKKSVFPTSFGRHLFKGISFENERDLHIIYLTSIYSKTSLYCRLLPSCVRIVKYGL